MAQRRRRCSRASWPPGSRSRGRSGSWNCRRRVRPIPPGSTRRSRDGGRSRSCCPDSRRVRRLAHGGNPLNAGGRAVRIEVEPIGTVRSPRAELRDDDWGGLQSRIVLDARFEPDALDGIEQFSHAEILFFFDRVDPEKIVAGARHPRNNRNWPAVGIFAQRAKARPNRIGSTIVRILRCEGRVLHVAELDAVDGTPVLDIKPVMQEFLPRAEVRQPSWSSELMQAYWKNSGPSEGS